MAFPRSISQAGRAFVEKMEGRRKNAYRDEAGFWTIGVGHTGSDVHAGLIWTDEQITQALDDDLARVGNGVKRALTREPTQGQFDAMVSLAFNIGVKGFAGSTVVKAFNAGDDIASANAFSLWRKTTIGGKKVDSPGLVKRRALEKAMFLEATPVAPVATTVPVEEVPLGVKSGTTQNGLWQILLSLVTGLAALVRQVQDSLMAIPGWIGDVAQTVVAYDPKIAGFLAIVGIGLGLWLIYHRWRTRQQGWL